MDEMVLMDAVERYLRGEMTEIEMNQFDDLRKHNAEVDQMVVAHAMFLQQVNHFGDVKNFKHNLQATHQQLVDAGDISEKEIKSTGASIVRFWNKHKKTIAVAASIACVTALSISVITAVIAPESKQLSAVEKLNKKIDVLEYRQHVQNQKLDEIISPKVSGTQISGGSSFLIDADGYLVTNHHVVNNATNLVVVSDNKEYLAKKVFADPANDIAILKIDDAEWKSVGSLPYSFRKTGIELGEEIFTLGFPRNEIVYNKGYMSASSGYNNDTLSIQIAISANPGNSGGPVLDANGEIIGILSTRDRQATEVVFATKAIMIAKALEELKMQDSTFTTVKLPAGHAMKGMDRIQQIKKMKTCVFMVKGY